ncbi:hypothetical protein FOPG_10031 [Fusarium oxysporum f. sp. conglutinans race 2 54008]|uniref:Uncharacterized protein n=1 Tax=Fusarium oxysporum f. sp. conglutinans race 2 54008 TaxID=1089457 RepID=X0HFJ5_FUSOX|nr:hypothetical protein FOPG_10031 [Fusarium oxysporum f. sp. conglutinans race 2 54008]
MLSSTTSGSGVGEYTRWSDETPAIEGKQIKVLVFR